jgi:hypothetical protein
MKKIIILIAAATFCGGCHIPYPSTGIRVPQVVETYEKVCTVVKNPNPDKISIKTHCRWVRTR